MFREEYDNMVKAGVSKIGLLEKNPLGYFVMSVVAGAFIGVGVMLMSTVGAYGAGTSYVKLAMGMVFSVALSLVVMAGAELFTGNNMVLFGAALDGKVSWSKLAKLWVVCFIGNWIGSIIIAALFVGTGLTNEVVGQFMVNASAAKMAVPFGPLVCRGMLCNFLVCLAVWCGFRCKNEVAKLIMIFWCITAFVSCGFEHSIANMTMLTVGMMKASAFGVAGVTIGGYFYNILVVALGNVIAGTLMVALPYFVASREK